MKRLLFPTLLALAMAGAQQSRGGDTPEADLYKKWKNGPTADPTFFPIAVWLQSPANAERYKAAGFNTYVGLWDGPTEEQLATLKKAGIRVFCEQNAVALKHLDDPVIAGWMHGDEPDNAQELPGGKGYGPPVLPAKIVAEYQQIQKADPTRPVMLNLGQGVAWDGWYGRGTRSHHPEDYPLYMKGSDIVSFDIYPVVHDNAEVKGKLEFVANGVDRLVKWSNGSQIVWNCIECTHIGNAQLKATPQQVRFEVWSSIIHGSRGLIYFVHQFKPVFREAALFDDPNMLKAVTTLNQEITSLAPVINSPSSNDAITATALNPNGEAQVDIMTRNFADVEYLFVAVGSGAEDSVRISGLPKGRKVEVIGENRMLTVDGGGSFEDKFAEADIHLYRIPSKN